MRVVLLETHAVPGVWKYDLGLAIELERLGAHVTIITSKAFPRESQSRFGGRILRDFPDLRAHRFSLLKGIAYLWGVLKAVWRIRGERFDVIHWQHYNTLPPAETLMAMLLRILQRSVVLTVHDVDAWSSVSGRAKFLIRATLRSADRIIVHHEVNLEELANRYNLDRTRMRVVPHGSFAEYMKGHLDRQASREMLQLPSVEPIALFFGEIRPEKGLVYLIRAMGLVRRAIPNVRLVVAGRVRHMDMSECIAAIQSGGLGDSIVMRLGYVEDELVEPYFSMADVVVLPYVAITQSGVLFESMTAGRPVVVTDVGAMGATVREEQAGLVVPPADPAALAGAITRIIADRNVAQRMGENGRRAAASTYSWSRCAKRTIEVYREICTARLVVDPVPSEVD